VPSPALSLEWRDVRVKAALMARLKTIKWFNEWKLVPENVESVFTLMERAEEPLRLRDACMKVKVPFTLMHALIRGETKLQSRYLGILAARSQGHIDRCEDAAKELMEKGKPNQAEAAAFKAASDFHRWQAAKWDKELYGEQVEVNVKVESFAVLLRRVSERKLAAVRGEVVAEQTGDTLTLPAPVEDEPQLEREAQDRIS